MAKVYTTDGVLLAKVMRDHLNDWPDKPADILLEDFDRDNPSMMLQQLSAAEKVRPYIDGSYIGVWNFSVWVRIDATDTASRLNALGCLSKLYEWLDARDDDNRHIHLPVIDTNRTATQILMPNAPSVVEKIDNGVEVYQAVMQLEYKYSVQRR